MHRPGADANFGAYLACRANDSIQFQYSGYFMAYRYCYNALVSAGGSVQAQAISSGETAELTGPGGLPTFFAQKQSAKATKVADKVNDTYIKASGDGSGVASSTREVCDLLVNLYLEEEVKPNMVEPEPTLTPWISPRWIWATWWETGGAMRETLKEALSAMEITLPEAHRHPLYLYKAGH